MTRAPRSILTFLVCLTLAACGDDGGGGTQADRIGVGGECDDNDDCLQSGRDGGISHECLLRFKGGYCGLEHCAGHDDCPQGSGCVAHEDGNNYCFRLCRDKPECNLRRSVENEANCSSSVDYAGEDLGKACVPPSGSD